MRIELGGTLTNRPYRNSVLARKIIRAKQKKDDKRSASRSSRRRILLKWSTGVLAATSATLLVAIATDSASSLWHAIYNVFNHPMPLVVSPASIRPANAFDLSPGGDISASLQYLARRRDVESFLLGDDSTSRNGRIIINGLPM